MDKEIKAFWTAVIAGVIVMLAFAVVTVNIYHLIPILNPFVGGLVTGLIARRGPMYGGRAGVVSGIIGGLIVSLDYLLGTGFLEGTTVALATLTGSLFLIVLIPFFAILSFIGGAVGGQIRH